MILILCNQDTHFEKEPCGVGCNVSILTSYRFTKSNLQQALLVLAIRGKDDSIALSASTQTHPHSIHLTVSSAFREGAWGTGRTTTEMLLSAFTSILSS